MREFQTPIRVIGSGLRNSGNSTLPIKGRSRRIEYQLHVNVQTIRQFGGYGRQWLRPANRLHCLLVEQGLARARSHPDAEQLAIPAHRELRIDLSLQTQRTGRVRVALELRDVPQQRLLKFCGCAVRGPAHRRGRRQNIRRWSFCGRRSSRNRNGFVGGRWARFLR